MRDPNAELRILNALVGLCDQLAAIDRTASRWLFAVADRIRRRWRYPSW